jgi:hypothetical protein
MWQGASSSTAAGSTQLQLVNAGQLDALVQQLCYAASCHLLQHAPGQPSASRLTGQLRLTHLVQVLEGAVALGWRPPPAVLQPLADKLVLLVNQCYSCTAQDPCHGLWLLTQLGYRPSTPAALQPLLEMVHERLPQLQPVDFDRIGQTLTRWQLVPGPAWLDALLGRGWKLVPRMNLGQLVNLVKVLTLVQQQQQLEAPTQAAAAAGGGASTHHPHQRGDLQHQQQQQVAGSWMPHVLHIAAARANTVVAASAAATAAGGGVEGPPPAAAAAAAAAAQAAELLQLLQQHLDVTLAAGEAPMANPCHGTAPAVNLQQLTVLQQLALLGGSTGTAVLPGRLGADTSSSSSSSSMRRASSNGIV